MQTVSTLTTLVNLLSWPSHLLMWSESAKETEEGLLRSDPELTTTIMQLQRDNLTLWTRDLNEVARNEEEEKV